VKGAGRGEGGIANGEFVLALISMRRVLLAGLERVQTGTEELSLGYRGLAHSGGVGTGPGSLDSWIEDRKQEYFNICQGNIMQL
jgi:hypothetical protein